MILGWSPFKIVSVSAVLYPRWPSLLKIEISSNGQNCSILSQKLKIEQFWPFEEISIFSNGGHLGYRTAKCSPLKLLSQSQPNFAEMILRWSPFKIVSVSAVLYPRWPPLLKIEPFEEISILSNGGHLGYRTGLTDTILKGDHLRIISAKFG
jgi:hypothetical protein